MDRSCVSYPELSLLIHLAARRVDCITKVTAQVRAHAQEIMTNQD